MDPFHAKLVADVEREIASFLDDLARTLVDGKYTREEIDYALRFAAGNLREKANVLEGAA